MDQVGTTKTKIRRVKRAEPKDLLDPNDPRVRPDHSKVCASCGDGPIVPLTGLCGPCTFGEADTAGGNW